MSSDKAKNIGVKMGGGKRGREPRAANGFLKKREAAIMAQALEIPQYLLDRLQPLVAQRQKDYEEVYLHELDKWAPPSRSTILQEAIEWYCDLHNPIDTTPAHRLPDKEGNIDLKVTPHSDILPKERSIAEQQQRIAELFKAKARIKIRCVKCGFENRVL